MSNCILEKLIYTYVHSSDTINYQICYTIYKKILKFYYFNYKNNKFQSIRNLLGFTNKSIQININLMSLRYCNKFIYYYVIKFPIKILIMFEICVIKYIFIKYSILLKYINIVFINPVSIIKHYFLKPFLINKLISTCSFVSKLLHYVYLNKTFLKLLNNKNSENIDLTLRNFLSIQKKNVLKNEEICKNPTSMFFDFISMNKLAPYQYIFEILDASLNKSKQRNFYSFEARIFDDLKYFNFIGNVFFFVGILTIKPHTLNYKFKEYNKKLHVYFIQVLSFKKKIENFFQIIRMYDKFIFAHSFSNKLYYYLLVNNLLPNINGNYHIKKGFLVQAVSIPVDTKIINNIYSTQVIYTQLKPINILLFGYKFGLKQQIYKFLKLLIENSFIISFSKIFYLKKKEELKSILNIAYSLNIQLICIQGLDYLKTRISNLIHDFVSNIDYKLKKNHFINFYYSISYSNWYNLEYEYTLKNICHVYNSIKQIKNMCNHYDLLFISNINLRKHIFDHDVKEYLLFIVKKRSNLLNFYSLKHTLITVKKLKPPYIRRKILIGLINYFVTIRNFSNFNKIFSPFFLESIIKISTSIAKLGFSQLIHFKHIKEALCIIYSKKHILKF
uniref:Minichromosome maintenance complex component 4 n=1 Tax=Lotharella vacuolata TaxID=74820 RepID=A0A0H5BGW4_9EUKA|nr:minichromosome maintenance complex component 4 [Lotharella vacuolata]